MEFAVAEMLDAKDVIATSSDPLIRLLVKPRDLPNIFLWMWHAITRQEHVPLPWLRQAGEWGRRPLGH